MARVTGKSGVTIAQEHVDALIEYLEAMQGRPLPRRDVELNRTAIARECGFDRQVFRTNPRCARLLADADEKDRIAYLDGLAQGELAREQKGAVDARQHALEEKLLRLAAQNLALQRRIDQLSRLEALLTETGRLP
ncbi:hypothetical protein [Ferirhizobium litorale]|uniref:Uncharacterized protein n=1 Tax=Ferirhizobium litorale TaxID=2927786 RepID=A0AAE3QCA8_9HYPH|nr:hypothetical protein [Fererhizobium litorale]MDI7923102.1 hypothetical protein [Fererhizobium litorale]